MDQTGSPTSPSKSVGEWKKSEHLKQWAAFLTLGCFAWGTSYLWIKIALEEIGPFMLVALRVTFGTIVIWLLVILLRIPLPRSRTAIVNNDHSIRLQVSWDAIPKTQLLSVQGIQFSSVEGMQSFLPNPIPEYCWWSSRKVA